MYNRSVLHTKDRYLFYLNTFCNLDVISSSNQDTNFIQNFELSNKNEYIF